LSNYDGIIVDGSLLLDPANGAAQSILVVGADYGIVRYDRGHPRSGSQPRQASSRGEPAQAASYLLYIWVLTELCANGSFADKDTMGSPFGKRLSARGGFPNFHLNGHC
jgi:hypothetical protein